MNITRYSQNQKRLNRNMFGNHTLRTLRCSLRACWRIVIMICNVRSDNIAWNEVHHGILFDRRLVVTVELFDRCIKCWSNLTLKCNANTFVKVDAKVKKECRWTICYLQGYSCPKLYCKKLSNSAETHVFSSQYKRNNFMLNAGQDSSNLLYSCPSLFEPILNNNTKTTKNYNHHRVTKQKPTKQVSLYTT